MIDPSLATASFLTVVDTSLLCLISYDVSIMKPLFFAKNPIFLNLPAASVDAGHAPSEQKADTQHRA